MIINKKIVFYFLCLVIFIFSGYLSVDSYSKVKKNIKNHNASTLDMIDQGMKNVISEINNFPSSASDGILFLSKLSYFKDFISSTKENEELRTKNIKNNFLEFLKQSPAYYQVTYIDKNGQEIVKAEYDGSDNHIIVGEDDLQNKKSKEYYKETAKLPQGKTLTSFLELNIKNGQIENRNSLEKPQYVPTIRYSTPVYDNRGLRGIIVVNVYADYFLEDVRRQQRNGDKLFLINSDGYFLAHPDKSQEFAFMFGGDATFQKEYFNDNGKLQFDCKKRRLNTDNYIFSYHCIYPQESSFEIYRDGQEDNGDNNDYWTLVTVTDRQKMELMANKIWSEYFWFLCLCAVSFSIIIVLMYLIVFKYGESYENQ